MSHDISFMVLARGLARGYHNFELLLCWLRTSRAFRLHNNFTASAPRAHHEPTMDIFKNFKTFGKPKSRDENSKLTPCCSELKTDMHTDDQSSSSGQSHGTINSPHTTATQPSRTVSALFQAHPQPGQPHTTGTEPPTTPSALALEQAHRDARRLETDAQRLVSSITTAIQLAAAESSRLLSLVEHNTITPITSEATEPSRLLSLGEHNMLAPITSVATEPSTSPPTGRREKILDEKNQLILNLSEDRDGWKNTAEESFKREDAWADKAEKLKGVALKQGEKLRALGEVATKRGEKIRGLEEEGEVWCRKMIELEGEVVGLRARAMEDSERIKELSQDGLDAEGEEDGWREMAEKAKGEVGEAKREVEKVKREAREWKKSSQDAEIKLKMLDEFEVNLKKREDELAKEEVKLKKREDQMVKKLMVSQDEVKALKDVAEVKVQAEIRKQNTIAGIKKDIIKALDRNDITSAKQSLGGM